MKIARLTLQTRKLLLVSSPTVTRVIFDVPECKQPDKKLKETQVTSNTAKKMKKKIQKSKGKKHFQTSKNEKNLWKSKKNQKNLKKKKKGKEGSKMYLPETAQKIDFVMRNVTINRAAIEAKNIEKKRGKNKP